MNDVINKTTLQTFEATDEQKALITEFLEDFKVQFPEVNPLFILPLLYSIDMKTWKYPEVFHCGAIKPQVEFIENHEGLRKLMQEYCPYKNEE